nr:MAG TPA: hypothetical protein [Caudoviricetes sp.]
MAYLHLHPKKASQRTSTISSQSLEDDYKTIID